MKIKLINNSFFEITTNKNYKLVCDPWIGNMNDTGTWSYPNTSSNKKILNKINPDLVYISHLHTDHYDEKIIKNLKNKNEKFLNKESALLFSSNSYKDLDFIIYVYANKSLRISRILNRDKFRTRDEIKKIINNQIIEEEASKKADFILRNNEKSLLLPKVIDVLDKINSNIKTTS